MTEPEAAEATIGGMAPFFIAADVARSIAFYRDQLGFALLHEEGAPSPHFAILRREGAMVFIKSEQGVAPVPNHSRHVHLRWDAYCFTPDPDALAADFSARGVAFATPLGDTQDGLRGFELRDPDGRILFFGCARLAAVQPRPR